MPTVEEFTPSTRLQEAYARIEHAQQSLEEARKAVLRLDSIWRDYYESVRKIAAALDTRTLKAGK